jgi:tryptophan halogenase
MKANRAPVARVEDRTVAAGPFHYAYHFDQARVGAWLRRKAQGVALIDDQITGVETGAGGIVALKLESGGEVRGDLFLDCTGFRRVLATALGAAWVGYGDVLPVNRAMPFWVPLREDEEIDPFTLAWAQGAGWMWRIPTQERYGCGYVYSDAHTTADQAKAEIEKALGHAIEPRNDIAINAGRLDRVWIGNTVALGLASSFLEPLEATSIHGTVVQLLLLAASLGKPGADAAYNATVARQVDDFRDFIRLHYVSRRRDTPFWRDVAANQPQAVTDRLRLWRDRIPARGDFAPFPLGLPHVEEQLYTPVLDGLGLLDAKAAGRKLAPIDKARLARSHAGLVSEYAAAAARCLPHRAYLMSLQGVPAS